MAAFLPNLFVTNEGIIMKRTIVMIVMIATLFTGMIFFSYAQRQQAVRADQPNITGQYGVTIDADTGEVLYGKREDERSYPASIAKMMTTLLLLENVKRMKKLQLQKTQLKQKVKVRKLNFVLGKS